MIAIVCDDASHVGKVVSVAEFHRRMDIRTPPGIPAPKWGPSDWVIEWGKVQGQNKSAADQRNVIFAEADRDQNHERYRLECRLCGLCVVVVEGKLVPLLMKAHDAGVSVVPLGALVAMISK
jgi:hypothetical protein